MGNEFARRSSTELLSVISCVLSCSLFPFCVLSIFWQTVLLFLKRKKRLKVAILLLHFGQVWTTSLKISKNWVKQKQQGKLKSIKKFRELYHRIMRWSNCSDPIPPDNPLGITFFGCPGLFITISLPCLALINHYNSFILQCPALLSLHFAVPRPFYHTHFSSDPGAAQGVWGQNNLTGA